MSRICIAGGPKVGKTTLGNLLGGDPGVVLHSTDDLIATHDWSAASLAASKWFDEPGDFVAEGVAIGRALRKWLAANHTGKPCDLVYWLDVPRVPLTDGQRAMSRGCLTVWSEIEPELLRRGVRIERPGPLPLYLLDGNEPTTLPALVAANEECPIADLDVRGIESLILGETWRVGGGAEAETTVRRIA